MKQLRAAARVQSRKLARLLTECSTAFSTGDGDVRRTSLVERNIPLRGNLTALSAWPREAEAERQVQELLQKGLIEPVVIVRKKDGN